MGKSEKKKADAGGLDPATIDLDAPELQSAIKLGLDALKEGKTKADAARLIYEQVKTSSKEVVVAAFMSGANLTAKGALTYWYNCRRRALKAA